MLLPKKSESPEICGGGAPASPLATLHTPSSKNISLPGMYTQMAVLM